MARSGCVSRRTMLNIDWRGLPMTQLQWAKRFVVLQEFVGIVGNPTNFNIFGFLQKKRTRGGN